MRLARLRRDFMMFVRMYAQCSWRWYTSGRCAWACMLRSQGELQGAERFIPVLTPPRDAPALRDEVERWMGGEQRLLPVPGLRHHRM